MGKREQEQEQECEHIREAHRKYLKISKQFFTIFPQFLHFPGIISSNFRATFCRIWGVAAVVHK